MAYQMNEVAQYLLRAIYQMHDRCRKLNEGLPKNKFLIKPGIVDNIAGLKFLLQKIRNSDDEKSIGFFGGQKRGKSSLINWLLGCDLMPTSAMPMTSAIVYVINDPTMEVGKFAIQSEAQDGARVSHGETIPLDAAKDTLKEIVSHAGSQSPDISRVWVTSHFPKSKILSEGGVLVDTPGAECAFEKKGRRSRSSAEQANEVDAQRAKQALKQVKVVVFVEKPEGMQSKNSKALYSDHVHDMRPICVINFRDQYDLDRTTEDRIRKAAPDEETLAIKLNEAKSAKLKTRMITTFGAVMERTFCVSCKESISKTCNAVDGDKRIIDTKKRNGISELEDKIIKEMDNLEAAKGVLTCVEDLEQFLGQIEEIEPEKVRDVFSAGLAAMCVFINTVGSVEADEVARDKIVSAAQKLFEKYAPRDRRRFAHVA